MSESSDYQAEALFDAHQEPSAKRKTNKSKVIKKEKKADKRNKDQKVKKQKAKNKQKGGRVNQEKLDYSQEQDQIESRNSNIRDMIEDQAQQESDEEEVSDWYDNAQQRQYYKDLYRVDKPRNTENFLKKFQGKDENQINYEYKRKASLKYERAGSNIPKGNIKIFEIRCDKGSETMLMLRLLTKAQYCMRHPGSFECNIFSAFGCQKRFSSLIFVEALHLIDVKNALKDMVGVQIQKIKETNAQQSLNNMKHKPVAVKNSQFSTEQMVRVKEGVYRGDLAKIISIHKNKARILIVPRINLKLIQANFQQIEQSIETSQNKKKLKNSIFQKLTDPRMFYEEKNRPASSLVAIEAFQGYSELPHNKKIILTEKGMIILSYMLNELQKPKGIILPLHLQPFSSHGNILKEFGKNAENKVKIGISLQVGQMVQIMTGQLKSLIGAITSINDGYLVLKIRNKSMKGKQIQQLPEHVDKYFQTGKRVRVKQGVNANKQGVITSLKKETAIIFTDNNNDIEVLRRNLEIIYFKEASQNSLGLILGDMIKTSKGITGVIFTVETDHVKILTTSHKHQIVQNVDYAGKVLTKNVFGKNSQGQTIKQGSLVTLQKTGLQYEVKHISRDYCFLYNSTLKACNGFLLERIDNCLLIGQRSEPLRDMPNKKKSSQKINNNDQQENHSQPIYKIGGFYTIKSGGLKGYKGIIKMIKKDSIQVKIPQKNETIWLPFSQLQQKQETVQNVPNNNARESPRYKQDSCSNSAKSNSKSRSVSRSNSAKSQNKNQRNQQKSMVSHSNAGKSQRREPSRSLSRSNSAKSQIREPSRSASRSNSAKSKRREPSRSPSRSNSAL